MKMKFAWVGLAALCAFAACEDVDETEEAVQPVFSQKGETCERSADCATGLACQSHVCVEVNIALTATSNECVAIECRSVDDCCSNSSNPDLCKEQARCQEDSCVQVRTCQDAYYDCYSGDQCVNGLCVECAIDDDCGFNQACSENRCVAACQRDSDCWLFQACQNGTCAEVGCKSDRECIASTGNAQALCRDSECTVPCATNLECANLSNFNFEACINSVCTSLGCETDGECRVRLGAYLGGARSGSDAECRAVN